MLYLKRTWLLIFVLVLFFNINSIAQEAIPTTKGYHGYFQIGYGGLHFRNNQIARFMSFRLNDPNLNSLNEAPVPQNTTVITLPFEIGYTVKPYKTHIFVGNQLEDLIRFDVTQQIGIKQYVKNVGVLHGGAVFSLLPTFVWEDPFLLGEERTPTRRLVYGGLLGVDQVLNSGLRIQYSYRQVKMGTEESGVSLALSEEDKALLDRNGGMHRMLFMYRFFLRQKHRLQPILGFTLDNRIGKARARSVADFSLNYILKNEKFLFIANGLIGKAWHKELNPIYNAVQEDWRYGLTSSLFFKNPWNYKLFGEKPFQFTLIAAYNYNNSNIEFYQQRGILLQLGLFKAW